MNKMKFTAIALALVLGASAAEADTGFWEQPDRVRHGLKGSPSKIGALANMAGYDSSLPNVEYNEAGYLTGWGQGENSRTIVSRDEQNRISSIQVISQWGDSRLNFKYGDHGKYIPVDMLINTDFSGSLAPNTRWYPEFIKDLTGIEVEEGYESSANIEIKDDGRAYITGGVAHTITFGEDGVYPLYDEAPDMGQCYTYDVDAATGRLRSKIFGSEPNDTLAWQALVYDVNTEDNRIVRSTSFGDPADYAYYIWDLTYDTDGRVIASDSEEPGRNYTISYVTDDQGNWTTANLKYGDGTEQPIEREITYYQTSEGVNHYTLPDLKHHNLKGDVKSCSYLADFTDGTYALSGANDVEYNKAGYVKGFRWGKTQVEVSRDEQNRMTRIQSTKDGATARIEFNYGDHGRYIPTESIFYDYNARCCTGYMAPWFPAMIRDLESIKLTMSNGANRTDQLTFTDEEKTAATLTGISDHTYSFNGLYPAYDEAKYEGFNSNFYIYDIDQATGRLKSRRIDYDLDPEAYIKQTNYNPDLANTPSEGLSPSRANTWKMEYNDNQDPISFTCEIANYSWTATYDYDSHNNWINMYRVNSDGEPMDTISRTITYWSEVPDDSFWAGPDRVRHALKGNVKSVGFLLDQWDNQLSQNLKDLEYDENGYLKSFYFAGDNKNSSQVTITRDSLNRITKINRVGQGDIKFTYGNHGLYIPMRQMLYRASWYVNPCYIPYWWPRFMRDLTQIEVVPTTGDVQTYNITPDPNGAYATVSGSADHYITFKDRYGVTDLGKYGEFNPNYFNYEVMPETGKLLRTYVGVPGDNEPAEDYWYLDNEANSVMRRVGYNGFDDWRYEYDESENPIAMNCSDSGYDYTVQYTYDQHDNWTDAVMKKGDTVWKEFHRPITYWGEEEEDENFIQALTGEKVDFHYDGTNITATGITMTDAVICSLQGQTMRTITSWDGGAINVRELPTGVYVLRAGRHALKFHVK